MRVLRQLIQHFWQRGALTLDQAHYFVEHGFVHAHELDSYEPRPADEDDTVDLRPIFPSEYDEPTDLEGAEEQLAEPARRKGRKAPPRPADCTLEQLEQRLEGLLQRRSACWPALLELARPERSGIDWREAAVLLRQIDEEHFRALLLRAVGARPAILGELWECVDDGPFHDLLHEPDMHGKACRAVETVLRAAPGQWGPAAWILQVPVVRTVLNLLAVRRRLIPAIRWLYEQHWARLARCMRRPTLNLESWHGLSFGLLVVYNARARRIKRVPPTGFVVSTVLGVARFQPEALGAALALDPAAVTPYLVDVFGSVQDLDDVETEQPEHKDAGLVCPYDWKI